MTRTIPRYCDDKMSPFDLTQAPSSQATSIGELQHIPSPTAYEKHPEQYAPGFCTFLADNPTVFHFVNSMKSFFKEENHFEVLDERAQWSIKRGGKYVVTRNGSSLIAFVVGENYKTGNGVAMTASHVDALTVKLKPISRVNNAAGYEQLGVAPYAGGLGLTWWDRDLGIAGKVLVKNSAGKVTTQLVNLDGPIARVPTLAPHFGAPAAGPFNRETQMVPIIGLDDDEGLSGSANAGDSPTTFASTQPPRLMKAIANELGIADYSSIVGWELQLFDSQKAQLGGLDKEFIYAGRLDDHLCSYAAAHGLASSTDTSSSSIVKCVSLFDNEEVGSLSRQGARGNFLPSTIERIVQSLAASPSEGVSAMGQTYANSFLASADNTHAVNPNFLNVYLANHAPKLNVGVCLSVDPNGAMTTDAVSTALMQRVARKCGSKLQVFQIRNDSRSGGTVGPMLSSAMGVRAADCGLPQLSMHSIRATTGSKDVGLGIQFFKGFFDHYEEVDAEFRAT
ncbi:MAG: hypothetical protein M1828_000458 [Chrysothrix sp. TS-e1954]|nr:MAG: hypothetical protein M1828_000458 [Chrysothrix sp. TS-e1954]